MAALALRHNTTERAKAEVFMVWGLVYHVYDNKTRMGAFCILFFRIIFDKVTVVAEFNEWNIF